MTVFAGVPTSKTNFIFESYPSPTMKGVVQVLRSLLLFASFFFFPMYSGPVQAQRGPVAYRLDKNNGLPTNHVYGSLVDHLGYLWLATPRGVVRYNGYEMKIFGVSNGLPKEDVWNLVEDSSGRIWLSIDSPTSTVSTVASAFSDGFSAGRQAAKDATS